MLLEYMQLPHIYEVTPIYCLTVGLDIQTKFDQGSVAKNRQRSGMMAGGEITMKLNINDDNTST
jgi:hypothetical protein